MHVALLVDQLSSMSLYELIISDHSDLFLIERGIQSIIVSKERHALV